MEVFKTIQSVSDRIQDFRKSHSYSNPTPRPVGDKGGREKGEEIA
jgi:hypothetical protein